MMSGRLVIVTIALLAALPAPCPAGFTLSILPSDPADSGSIGTAGAPIAADNAIATNLRVGSITDVATGQSVALNQFLDFQSGPAADFFVLAGLVRTFGGTEPFAYGLGGHAGLATSSVLVEEPGGVDRLVVSGLDARLTDLLAPIFHVDPAVHYAGTLTVEWVVDTGLAGGQVLGGEIELEAIPPVGGPGGAGVPEPGSCVMVGVGLAAVALLRRKR